MRITYFLFITLLSCGSLIKRDDYIRVDSSPRGLPVKLNKQKHGVTPTLIPRPDQKNNQLKIGQAKYELKCELDYYKSVVPNGVYTIFNPPVGGMMYAIDYFRDSMYKCPIKLNYNVKAKSLKKAKPRLAFLPLKNRDQLKKSAFLNEISQKIKKYERTKNFELISYNKSLPVFLSNGLGYEKEWNIKHANVNALNRVIKKLEITHLINIEFEGRTARLEVIDIYKNKIVKVDEIEIDKKIMERNDLYRFTNRTISLIPNAISLAQSFNGIYSDDDESGNTYVSNKTHPDALKGTLSYLSFDSVISPLYYKPFDYDYFFAPAGQLTSFRSVVQELQGFEYNTVNNVDVIGGFFTMDFVIAGITPLTTPSLRLGAGYSILNIEDQQEGDKLLAKPVTKLELDFTSFITDRLYFNLSASNYALGGDGYKIAGKDYESVSIASVGIGYYLPETYHWVDRYFGF